MTASVLQRAAPARPAPVTLGEAFWVWLRISLLSFGGPAGQIAVMHRILVEEKRWIGEHRFLHALNYCMLLPGPEAQQLATYIGWLMHRTKGGIVAGTLFVLPGAAAIMALSWVYVLYGRVGIVSALFFGLKAAVLAVVLQAVVRIGGRALRTNAARALAAVAFILIFFLGAPFPLIVLGAGLIGWWAGRQGVAAFKGEALTFRSWDQQLRQPVLLAGPRMLVSISPQEGFLHPKYLTDSLGTDEPESECRLRRKS